MPGLQLVFNPDFENVMVEYAASERGRKLLKIAGISEAQLDVQKMAMKYFANHVADVSVDPNANVGNSKCPNNFATEVMKGQSKRMAYWLMWSRLAAAHGPARATSLIKQIWDGHLYFHDISGHGITSPYCFAASTLPLIYYGRPYGQLRSKPPKRANSFISQAIEYTMDMSQEFMGAVALGDLLVNHAMMCLKDGVDLATDDGRKKYENDLQQFVHVVNNKFRTGAQSPFTNVSVFDRPQLKALFHDYEYPDGARAEDHIEYLMRAQEIFLAFIARKDPISGLPYRFPVVTVNLTTEQGEILDEQFLQQVCRYNTEGVFNIYLTDGLGKVASCCRLLSDVRRIRDRQRADVWGNGGLNVGSTRVCTINLARAALDAKTWAEFKDNVMTAMTDSRDLLLEHRKILAEAIDANYLKFFKPLKWISLDMLFTTFGVVGLYEALARFGSDYVLPSEKGVAAAKELLQQMDAYAMKISETTGVPFNIEQVPAEQAAVSLADADRVFYPDLPWKMYSNQSIPLWVNVDLITRAKIDGELCKSYSGGGICHLNVASAVTPGQMNKMVRFAARTGLDHLALNMAFSQCEDGHTSVGKFDVCPRCGKKIVLKQTRVVGYMVPVSDWSEIRREWEFPLRAWWGPENLPAMAEPVKEATACRA